MGDRWRPKSVDGVRESAGTKQGSKTLDEYGRGDYDEATGLYEWYEDVPEEVTGGKPISWVDLFKAWKLIEADFNSEYGINLERELRHMSWRRFAVLVTGLLNADTRIQRRFQERSDDG